MNVTLAATLAVSLSLLGAVSASTPSAAAPAAVGEEVIGWVEVEDGEISGGAAGPPVFNSGDHGNFSGTGSYTFRETGMTSTMSVDAPEAGVYPIHVRYAAGPLGPGENVTRSIGLLTNGGDRQQMSLPMTSTEDWESWEFVTYEVTLDEGANTVAIQCDRSIDFCRLNFDAIQVGGPAPDPCAATPPDAGYTSLFDGTFATFDGWRKAAAGGFGRQTDCTIRSVRGRGATWFTEQQSAPYTLELDWRQAASNDDSSVHLASSSRDGADPAGGVSVRIGADTGAIVPAGGAMQPADPVAVASALHDVGDWNTFTIRVTPTQVTVDLNGTFINAFDSPAALPASGYIGLENRSSTDEVDFKDIQVKPGVDLWASTTSVDVDSGSLTVGRGTVAVSVTVASTGPEPTGDVALYVDGARQATLALRDGDATARMGPFTSVGTKRVVARYLGSATLRPSSSAVSTVAVRKARPRMAVAIRPGRIVADKTRAKVVVAVSAPGITPSGRVRLRTSGPRKSYVGRLRSGKATIALPRFPKAGTVRATVTYLGDARTASASKTVRIRVRR